MTGTVQWMKVRVRIFYAFLIHPLEILLLDISQSYPSMHLLKEEAFMLFLFSTNNIRLLR